MSSWFTHFLLYGFVPLVLPTALLLVALRWGRSAFAEDYPPDIRAVLPELGRGDVLRGRVLGPAFLISLLGVACCASWSWIHDDPARGFWSAYLMAAAVIVAFSAIDLLVVDWLVICRLRPAWVVIPGTQGCADWGDYGFHLRAQLSPKCLAALLLLPAAIAGGVTVIG